MSRSDDPDPGDEASNQETAVLVCGLCRRILDGRHGAPGRADRAADDHVLREHPDRSGVVVLPVSTRLAKTAPDQLTAIAADAQDRADTRRRPTIDPPASSGSGKERVQR